MTGKAKALPEGPKAPPVWRCPKCGRPHLYRNTCAFCGEARKLHAKAA